MQQVYVLAAGNERGGAASHLVSYAKALANSTHPAATAVTFLIAGQGDLNSRFKELEPHGVRVRRVSAESRRVVVEVSKILRETPGSGLHSHGPRWNVLAARIAKRVGCRWTSTIHSHPDLDFLASRWKTFILPRLHRRALRSAAGVFVVNPDFAALFPGKPCKFVPNAVEPIALPEPRAVYRSLLRQQLGVLDDVPVIGVAARLDKVKDLGTLIRAVKNLQSVNVHLAIAGDGPERDPLEHLAKDLGITDRVHFLGFISGVSQFYAGLDVHVLTSRSEGAPSAVIEAGWVGTPNVGTDIPGLVHLIDDGKTGALVPVGDAVALAGAISGLISNPELATSYTEKFAEKVLPKYLPEKMVSSYLEGYETFLGSVPK